MNTGTVITVPDNTPWVQCVITLRLGIYEVQSPTF